MSAVAPHHDLTLADYPRLLRRHRRWIVALALVGVGVGILLVVNQPLLYTARSRVAVTPQDVTLQSIEESTRRQLVSLDSDAQVLSSTRVLGRAATATGVPGGITELRDRVGVSALPSSRVLIVSVAHPDPAAAVELTTAVVDAFLADRAESGERRVEAARADLEQQLESVSERLAVLRASNPLGDDVVLPSQQAEEEELSEQVTALQGELVRAAATAGDAGVVIVPARITAAGSRPMAVATLSSGLLLGAGAGLGVSVARTARRRDQET